MTSLLIKPVAEWTLEDLERLVRDEVEEGQRLEYKRELNLATKSERREAARDASGMANASGGLLIYGIEEKELPDRRVVPHALRPLSDHELRDRLEEILDSTISPRLRVEMEQLPADSGYLLVLRIHQRVGVPHMVEGYDDHRYHVRRGRRVVAMTEREVAQAFEHQAVGEQALVALLDETPLAPRLTPTRSRTLDLTAASGSAVILAPWLSVVTVPLAARSQPLLRIDVADPKAFGDLPETPRLRSGDVVGSHGFQVDHLGYFQEFRDSTYHPPFSYRLRLYRNGVFEWGGRPGPMMEGRIPTQAVVEYVHDALAYFGSVYRRIDYFGPVSPWVALENVEGTYLGVREGVLEPHTARSPEGTVDLPLRLPDTPADELAEHPMRLVQLAMDYIWQAYGWPRCQLFEPDGTYNPDRSW